MELIGMAIGSILLGGVADRIGRRPTILGCLVVMAVGMFMATTVDQRSSTLSIWRVVTGLGIGGMLAAINAVAAEFSNDRRRHLSVSLMSIGYPVGAVVGGLVAAQLLQGNDWRSVFYFGAARHGRARFRGVLRRAGVGALARAQAARRRARDDQPRADPDGARRPSTALPVDSAEARNALGRRHLRARTGRDDGDRDAGVLLPHHDVLLHRQVDPEDRRGPGLRRRRRPPACWCGPTWAAPPAAPCSAC